MDDIKANNNKHTLSVIVIAFCTITALFHIYTSYAGALDMIRHRSLHLTLIMIVCFLNSARKRATNGMIALDIALALATFACGLYVFIDGPEMPLRSGEPSTNDLIVGAIFILLTLEATRRSTGTAMAVICVFFLFYTMFGQFFPGFLKHAPYSFEKIINEQFIEMSGLWGVALGMSATFIIVFIIFGEFLNEAGITKTFMDLGSKLMGKTVGASAKVATIMSVLVGSITGSAAASVMVTGAMTIPGMKKTGYSNNFIAAVQAIGGTGGQVMPPVMGSAAFIIAAFLGVPYIQVCKAALFPALLFYFCLFAVVHFKTQALGLKTMTDTELESITWSSLLKQSYLFLPLIVLTYMLVIGSSPMYAGFIGVVTLLVVSCFRKENRFTLTKLLNAFEKGIIGAIPVTMSCAAAGIIVGCIMQSGLGYTISASLVRISGGQPYPLAILVLIACLILGMGMTTVGAYIIVASLVAPALIKTGIAPIAAHMFPFYLAILSAITPPVAVAAYAAAGLTQTNPWNVGLEAFYYSIPIFCIPFIFFSQPELLLQGDLLMIAIVVASSFLGALIASAGLVGFYKVKLSPPYRFAAVAIAALLCWQMLYLKAIGLVLAIAGHFYCAAKQAKENVVVGERV